MQADFERRLQRLEDREEIRALAARYTFMVDDRDIAGIEALFAPDARFRSKDGVMDAKGRSAVMAQFDQRFAALGHGAHYSHDHVIWFDDRDPDKAFGRLSSHAELVRNGAPMVAALRYADEYARIDGRWAFAERLLSFFYYLRADDYAASFGALRRVKAYDRPQEADYPEALESWRRYREGA